MRHFVKAWLDRLGSSGSKRNATTPPYLSLPKLMLPSSPTRFTQPGRQAMPRLRSTIGLAKTALSKSTFSNLTCRARNLKSSGLRQIAQNQSWHRTRSVLCRVVSWRTVLVGHRRFPSAQRLPFFDLLGPHNMGRADSPVTSVLTPGLNPYQQQLIAAHAVYFCDPIAASMYLGGSFRVFHLLKLELIAEI
jgi:hypothetical protein